MLEKDGAQAIASRARPSRENHEPNLEWLSAAAERRAFVLGFLHLINPLYTASGFAVGMLVGFTGVGGGSLMTPLLVLLFGIHPATAVGTDLLYAGLTKICGSAVHGFNDSIDWRVLRRMALGSIPATAVTIWGLSHFGVDSKGAGATITTTLGFALILTAITRSEERRFIAAAG